MSRDSAAKYKGKGRAKTTANREVIDLTLDLPSSAGEAGRLTPPSSPPSHDAPPLPSTPVRISVAEAGLSLVTPPTSKRKSQSRITSYYPNKRNRIEIVPTSPTPAERKANRVADRADKEAEREAARAAKAETRRREREARDARRAEEDNAKDARAAARAIEKEQREAEAAQKKEEKRRKAQWKADWKTWMQRNKQVDATFEIPEGQHNDHEKFKNIKECKQEFGIKRDELDCIPHCDTVNPINEEYAPEKRFSVKHVMRLAWKKEAIENGIPQNDIITLIEKGRELYEARTGQKIGQPDVRS